uniref:CARD domain-containing protein n=1 Tax=Amphimedon queenslandica TaxID=400682 RepID=A0A1X7U8Q5_AMPQE
DTLEDDITERYDYSMSVYDVTPSISWVVVFGGRQPWSVLRDTNVLEIEYSNDELRVRLVPLDQYKSELNKKYIDFRAKVSDNELYTTKLMKEKSQLQERVTSLEEQSIKETGSIGLPFNYLIPSMDSLDSSVIIAGQKLFILQGDRSHSLQWEKYGFRLECPQGAVSKDTEVAVTALAGGNFKVPKDTVLVSAVYAISVSKALLKPLVIELQHCVDLRKTSQTGCLKFVRAPLKSPYQFSIVEGGSFRVGKRYGSIKREQFCCMGIVAEMSNGDTPSDSESEEGYETPPEGSTDDTHNDSDNGAGETSERTALLMNTGLSQESVTDDSNQKLEEVESTSGASNVSNESTEDEVKQKPNEDKRATLLYTGMMYHEKKKVNQWMTTFSVVRDLEVLQQYLGNEHPEAEKDGPIVPFKYNQPDGILQLCLQDTPSLESGWTVHPDQSPMEIHQCVVDKFIENPMCSSIHISVYAKPGIAKDPLHCPIELTGIDPSITIYINRIPSSFIDSTSSSSSTASISQTRRETEKGTFRSDIAHRVMTECTSLVKDCGIDIHFLVDKLLEHKIVNAREKRRIVARESDDERMDELLHIILSSIRMNGKVFGIFLDILREEDTLRTIGLADELIQKYNNS